MELCQERQERPVCKTGCSGSSIEMYQTNGKADIDNWVFQVNFMLRVYYALILSYPSPGAGLDKILLISGTICRKSVMHPEIKVSSLVHISVLRPGWDLHSLFPMPT